MAKVCWVALCWATASILSGLPASAQIQDDIQDDVEVVPEDSLEEAEDASSGGYIGIGGNIGLSGGQTSISEGGFAIVNKTKIIDYLALRTALVIGDGSTSTVALTGEFPLTREGSRAYAIPFAGAGVSIEDDIAPLLTAGVDLPLSGDFTITNRVNVSFGDDETDVGVLVGVGYNFSIFDLFR